MLSTETMLEQALSVRQLAVKLLKAIPFERAGNIPPTWKNNAHWHAGHLILTPHMITYGVMKQPLAVPEEYRKWFARGTSPAGWGDDPVPPFSDLTESLLPDLGKLYESLKDRMDEPYLEPYTTSTGFTMRNPAESLAFSTAHDAIHVGLIMALKRALEAQP